MFPMYQWLFLENTSQCFSKLFLCFLEVRPLTSHLNHLYLLERRKSTCISQISILEAEAIWCFFKQREFLFSNLNGSENFGRADGADSGLYSSGICRARQNWFPKGATTSKAATGALTEAISFHCRPANGHQSCFRKEVTLPATGSRSCQTLRSAHLLPSDICLKHF